MAFFHDLPLVAGGMCCRVPTLSDEKKLQEFSCPILVLSTCCQSEFATAYQTHLLRNSYQIATKHNWMQS